MIERLQEYLAELDRDIHRRWGEAILVAAALLAPWLVGVFVIVRAPFAILFGG